MENDFIKGYQCFIGSYEQFKDDDDDSISECDFTEFEETGIYANNHSRIYKKNQSR